jgi:hypothetical protein
MAGDGRLMALRILALAFFFTLLGGIIWAAAASNLSDGMSHLLADRWGVVTLIDIYGGALFVAAWMKLHERNLLVWLLLIAGLIGLGHLTTLGYLVYRTWRAHTFAEVFVPKRLLSPTADA